MDKMHSIIREIPAPMLALFLACQVGCVEEGVVDGEDAECDSNPIDLLQGEFADRIGEITEYLEPDQEFDPHNVKVLMNVDFDNEAWGLNDGHLKNVYRVGIMWKPDGNVEGMAHLVDQQGTATMQVNDGHFCVDGAFAYSLTLFGRKLLVAGDVDLQLSDDDFRYMENPPVVSVYRGCAYDDDLDDCDLVAEGVEGLANWSIIPE